MDRIDELIYHLQGTSMSFEEACNDLGFDSEDLTMAELEELDDNLFCCSVCGLWCDISELSKETYMGEDICVCCESDL